MSTLYDELGLTRRATDEEIQSAYRKLARQFHPDKNPGFETQAKERFQRIQHAFDVLSNPAKRAKYDQSLDPAQFAAGPLSLVTPIPDININEGSHRKQNRHRASVVFLSAAAIIAIIVVGLILLTQGGSSGRIQPQRVASKERPPSSRVTGNNDC